MKSTLTLFCVYLTLSAAVCAQSDGRGRDRRPQRQAAVEPLPLEHGGKIETNYDGFEHETIVALKKMRVACEATENSEKVKGLCVSLQAALHCPGKQTDYVRRATIRVTFESKSWDRRHDAHERDLSAVADGETIRLGRMTPVSNEVSDGLASEHMRETLEASVPYAAFLKLARASYVEFSVGRTAFALSVKNVAALRDMNNRVKLPPASAAGGN